MSPKCFLSAGIIVLYTIILLTNPGLNTPQCSKISWRDAAGPRKVANKYTKIGCLFCTSGVSDQIRQQNLRSLSCADHALTLCSDISFSPTAFYTWKPLPIKHPWLKLLSWTFLAFAAFCSDFVKRGEPQKLEALQKDLSEQRDSVPWGAKLRLQNQSENYVTFWCFWL